MSTTTNIEWCDSTFNPWTGCTKVSPGCDHCYAESWAKRSGIVQWGPHAERRRTSASNWKAPLHWERHHETFRAEHGRRRRVFCASLADVFDNQAPAEWREDLFELIRLTPHLDWLLLTKRPQNIVRMVREQGAIAGNGTRYLPDHVWLGATAEDQQRADQNVQALLRTRHELGARILFLSVEPMLGPVDLRQLRGFHNGCTPQVHDSLTGYSSDTPWGYIAGKQRDPFGRGHIDWVICGGESGPGARPMHPEWARSLRDQCAAAGTPFLFKQWGEWLPVSQMDDEFMNRLYKPNRVAKLHEDQDALNDCYGRRCVVPQGVHQADGTLVDIASPMAFRVGLGSMQIFKVGKKAAGRLLDGREHSDFPLLGCTA